MKWIFKRNACTNGMRHASNRIMSVRKKYARTHIHSCTPISRRHVHSRAARHWRFSFISVLSLCSFSGIGSYSLSHERAAQRAPTTANQRMSKMQRPNLKFKLIKLSLINIVRWNCSSNKWLRWNAISMSKCWSCRTKSTPHANNSPAKSKSFAKTMENFIQTLATLMLIHTQKIFYILMANHLKLSFCNLFSILNWLWLRMGTFIRCHHFFLSNIT